MAPLLCSDQKSATGPSTTSTSCWAVTPSGATPSGATRTTVTWLVRPAGSRSTGSARARPRRPWRPMTGCSGSSASPSSGPTVTCTVDAGRDAVDVLGGDADGVTVGVLHPADRPVGLGRRRPRPRARPAPAGRPRSCRPAGRRLRDRPGSTTAAATARNPPRASAAGDGGAGRTGQKASPSASAVPARVGTVGAELSGTLRHIRRSGRRAPPAGPVRRARRPPSAGGRPR